MKKILSAFLHSPHFKRNLIIIIASVLTVAMTVTGVVIIANNDNDDSSGKQIPVYQGMTISSASDDTAGYIGNFALASNTRDEKTPGKLEGDFNGRNEEIDKDNPYPENGENETIEEEIKSSLDVIGSAESIYYAIPSEDIYINIHISNPDSFEIMSFTLNGKKYSSYMFEEGSDMETIVLKYNVGDTSGIVEYTIDAIKYIDGTEIKDVVIDGDKTVRAGIRTDNQLSVNVTDVDIDTNALSFNVNVKDNDELVKFSKGALKAVIYDGFVIIAEKDLTVGQNSVSFDSLKTNSLYQYAVVGYYDDLSGSGFKMNVLYKDAFYTDSVVLFDNVVIGQENVNFSFLWHEDHAGKSISALKLYQGDRLVATPDSDATEITDLFSDNAYTLVAEYLNGAIKESISIDFVTLIKAAPDFAITNTAKGQENLSFSINVTDVDSVGSITKVELIHASGVTTLENVTTHEITELLSDNDYTLKVTYTYDLNDGAGAQTITKELAVKTEAKATPEVTITNTDKTQTSLKFSVSVVDSDSVGAITKVELIHASGVTTLENVATHEISDLLSNNNYTLKVTYTYDLNDGIGAQTITKELAVKTEAKATPEISVHIPTKTQTSVGFTITETDIDNVGEISKIELYLGSELIKTADNINAREFAGLLSNNTYTVKVTYVYNLNDGEGNHTVTKELSIKTNAKAAPEVTITNTDKTQTSLKFSVSVVDADSVGAITKVELIHGAEVTDLENVTAHEIKNLLSNNDYTFKVTYTYDLNDGEGAQTITKELAVKTEAKATPEISVHTPTKTQTSVGFTITETDTDNVGDICKIELYLGSELIKTADNVNAREFAGLLSNNTYTVKVTYVYNLNDGEGEQTITKELAVKTEAKATPEISVHTPTKTQTSVGFTITETDTDNVGDISKIELYLGSELVKTADNLSAREFAGLLSNNTYTVKVTYVYNLNDGEGAQTITKELSAKTVAKTAPSFTVKDENIGTESISAEYDVKDKDNILASYKIELYQGNTLVAENKEKKINFSSLPYYTEYTVKFTYKYDLNDGNGEQAVIYDYTFKTLPYIDVTECNVANTSAVSEGETIFMSVKLDNPLGMSIESVVINDETYNVTGSSTTNKIFVEIVYNGQFVGGDTHLNINKINTKLDGNQFIVEPQTQYSDNVFINGKLEVLKIEFANEDFETIDWTFPLETVYVLITLNNPTGYTIDNVNSAITELTQLDDNRWYYPIALYNGWNQESINNLEYHNEYISNTLVCSNIYTYCYKVKSDDIKYISTSDDLKNMNEGYYYELKNDIDLSGVEWLGSKFSGVFNGKDYVIKNMSFVGTIQNTGAMLGLFSEGKGVIQNINISNATIIADVFSNNKESYDVFCGGFVAKSSGKLIVNDCGVDSDSILSIKTIHRVYLGGFIGYAESSPILNNCYNNGSINATKLYNEGYAGYSYAGGLIGYADCSTITNCANTGSISGVADDYSYVGGLIGFAEAQPNIIHTTTVSNCYNYGNISSSQYAGGLIGYANYYSFIFGCYDFSRALVGYATYGTIYDSFSGSQKLILNCYTVNIKNSYSLNGNSTLSGNPCSIEQVCTISFYTNILGWSEDIWDFSDLDVENGKYPKHRS